MRLRRRRIHRCAVYYSTILLCRLPTYSNFACLKLDGYVPYVDVNSGLYARKGRLGRSISTVENTAASPLPKCFVITRNGFGQQQHSAAASLRECKNTTGRAARNYCPPATLVCPFSEAPLSFSRPANPTTNLLFFCRTLVASQ